MKIMGNVGNKARAGFAITATVGMVLLGQGAAHASTTASFTDDWCYAQITVSGSDASSYFKDTSDIDTTKVEDECIVVQEREVNGTWEDASSVHTLGAGDTLTTYSYAIDEETRDCVTPYVYNVTGSTTYAQDCGNYTS